MIAKRLMTILVKADARPKEPVANAQIQSLAIAAGLHGAEFLDALTSAGGNHWIDQATPGFTVITQAGWENGNA